MRIYLAMAIVSVLFVSPALAHEDDDYICPDATTTIEINACLKNNFDENEKIRLELENTALENAKNIEDEYKKMGSVQYSDFSDQTTKSREAFEAYREQECSRVMTSYGAGTGAGTGNLGCQITLTEQRIEQLKDE